MKVAIVTFHRAYNCGAMLQAWAMMQILKKMGFNATFPTCNQVGQVSILKLRRQRINKGRLGIVRDIMDVVFQNLLAIWIVPFKHYKFNRFRKRNLAETEISVECVGSVYDCAIFGSDQIWNVNRLTEGKNDDTSIYLGECFGDLFPKIAYGISIGEDAIKQNVLKRLLAAAKRFDALSFREERPIGLGFRDRQGNCAAWVLDPSLLLSYEQYDKIAKQRRMVKGRYAFIYAMVSNKFIDRVVERVEKELGIKVIVFFAYHYGYYRLPRYGVVDVSPDEFLAYIRDAECVLAMSFHGTAFSIIYGKPFVSLRDEVDAVESRSHSLLRRLNLLNRFVSPINVESDWIRFLKAPPKIGSEWCFLRESSIEWLRTCILNALKN